MGQFFGFVGSVVFGQSDCMIFNVFGFLVLDLYESLFWMFGFLDSWPKLQFDSVTVFLFFDFCFLAKD